jgi:1-acyl-sn-glycerol-3-phosphate acyltransferase
VLPTPLAYHTSRLCLRAFFRIRYGLQVTGAASVPRRGGVVVACNHVSYLDPLSLAACCPRRLRFMARANLFDHWLLGPYLRSTGVMPLQREERDVAALRLAIERLRRGEAVAIFPEGGRQFSGQLGAAKRGVGLLAATARVPIVPVLVQGTFEALPPDASRLRRAKIRVAFGKPIPYTTGSVSPPGETVSSQRSSASVAPAREQHQVLADAVTHQWHELLRQTRSNA